MYLDSNTLLSLETNRRSLWNSGGNCGGLGGHKSIGKFEFLSKFHCRTNNEASLGGRCFKKNLCKQWATNDNIVLFFKGTLFVCWLILVGNFIFQTSCFYEDFMRMFIKLACVGDWASPLELFCILFKKYLHGLLQFWNSIRPLHWHLHTLFVRCCWIDMLPK